MIEKILNLMAFLLECTIIFAFSWLQLVIASLYTIGCFLHPARSFLYAILFTVALFIVICVMRYVFIMYLPLNKRKI